MWRPAWFLASHDRLRARTRIVRDGNEAHKAMHHPDIEPEQIDGLDDAQGSFWQDYPLDDLLIRHESRTVHEVLRRIARGQFVMNPDFQRDFVWDTGQQSKLIESIIMRIPLPVLYLAEDDEGRMIVVDGLQRLSTFKRFVENELKLKLPDRPLLNGKQFNDLSPKLQNRIEDCNLILYVIDQKVPEQARLDIFDRVNSGVPLTRQQMRNSLYTGPATRFLKTEANRDLFLEATGRSLKVPTMRDREFVNRFCAFQILSLDEYRDMDEFLAKALRKMNAESGSLERLSLAFQTTLSNNLYLFGKHAFRKHTRFKDNRSVLNASLWDVMSTGLSRHAEPVVKDHADSLRAAFYRLITDAKLVDAITYGPSDPRKVSYRFSAVRTMLKEVFGADAS